MIPVGNPQLELHLGSTWFCKEQFSPLPGLCPLPGRPFLVYRSLQSLSPTASGEPGGTCDNSQVLRATAGHVGRGHSGNGDLGVCRHQTLPAGNGPSFQA